jgi:hypothetical protein
MPVPFRSPRLLAAGAVVALAASFLVAGGSPASAITYPPMTVNKVTAHSGEDHGDMIDESGSGCNNGESTGSITMNMATGVVADDQPIDTDLTDNSFGATVVPDGDWSGVYSVQGGPGNALPSGQYTLRTECSFGATNFLYAGVVITINGEEVTTTTAAPTTTANPGTTSTTAAPTTTVAPTTTATPAAAVAAQATFTG